MTTTQQRVAVTDDSTIEAFSWSGTLDDLVHFVYGNQNGLFSEGACVYRESNDSLTVLSEHMQSAWKLRRVYGTWEHSPMPKQYDSEQAWAEAQDARGDLAGAPDYLEDIESVADDASSKVDEAENAEVPLGFGRD